jgi:hypothetical protein
MRGLRRAGRLRAGPRETPLAGLTRYEPNSVVARAMVGAQGAIRGAIARTYERLTQPSS